ncbi:MAG: hypothetical protein JWM33_1853 [Caulobacteraceae bacterium]|nr:hypothetical protein [Caulobacteraceae bacterium]
MAGLDPALAELFHRRPRPGQARPGRAITWIALAAAAALLGGSAAAGPMSNADYATRVQVEVDFQNMTCSELDYLWHVFDEMVELCRPIPPPPAPPLYTPQRICHTSDPLHPIASPAPTYRLSPDLYQTLGPTQRAYLAQAGVPWDVDADQAELRGAARSSTQFFITAPINALAGELETAARLKNCHSF